MRVLMTGARGFIGSRVAARLRDLGHEVLDARELAGGGDLLGGEARARAVRAARAEVLVHTAWVTSHGLFWTSPLNADWHEASADLFARFAAAGGRRIVGIGSVAEYDWSTGADRLAETSPILPATAYGAAKARTADALARIAASAGIGHAWARVFFTFGPGEAPSRLVPSMAHAAIEETRLDTGPAELARDFLGVDRLGEVIARIAASDAEGPLNVASGEATRLDALAGIIGGALGRAVPIRYSARPAAAGEPLSLVADTSRLAALGIETKGLLRGDLAGYSRMLAAAAAQR